MRYEDSLTNLQKRIHETPHAEFLEYLFKFCDSAHKGSLSLENAVLGLERLAKGDLMSRMDAFFAIHAQNADGLSREQYVACVTSQAPPPGAPRLAPAKRF